MKAKKVLLEITSKLNRAEMKTLEWMTGKIGKIT